MGSTSCIILGFSFASTRGCEFDAYLFFLEILQCRNPGKATSTLTLIVLGTALLISAGFHEVYTTRDALFPRAIFSNFNISMSVVPCFSATSLIYTSYYPYCQPPSQRCIQHWNILSSLVLPGTSAPLLIRTLGHIPIP